MIQTVLIFHPSRKLLLAFPVTFLFNTAIAGLLYVLNAGGSAIEAMVAAAATIAVAYPHMNGLGGDAFWIIHRPGQAQRWKDLH